MLRVFKCVCGATFYILCCISFKYVIVIYTYWIRLYHCVLAAYHGYGMWEGGGFLESAQRDPGGGAYTTKVK